MPWQQHVADVVGEVDPDTGLLVYREINLLVPRQSGKTTLTLAKAVHRAVGVAAQHGPQRIVYTAQKGRDARAKFLDEHVPIVERSAFGRRRPPLFTVRKSQMIGEAILWRNGSQHGISAPTETAGHGGTVDEVFLDEAFAHVDWTLEQGLRPTMITRPQPQLWVLSTAGTPKSVYLWAKVEAGRQRCVDGTRSSIAYFEWSADDDDDPGDPETWRRCMPALGYTVSESAIAAEFEAMSLPEFKRAYLNVWDPRRGAPVISADQWSSLADARSRPEDPLAFSFDISPDRAWAAVAVAGRRADGLLHLEVVDHRPGTDWLIGRLAELQERHRPKVIAADYAGPGGSLKAELERRQLVVREVTAREHAQACGSFYDAAMAGWLRHLGQPTLAAAVDGAVKRPLGDAWAWSRKSSSVDICPLVAVTLAGWALTAEPEPVEHEAVVLWG